MGSSLGFLLSLFFVVAIVAYSGDLCAIQTIYANLDSAAVSAGHQISLAGCITDEIEDYVYEAAKAYIVQVGEQTPKIGGSFAFEVYRDYNPLIIRDAALHLKVYRSVVIGYIE